MDAFGPVLCVKNDSYFPAKVRSQCDRLDYLDDVFEEIWALAKECSTRGPMTTYGSDQIWFNGQSCPDGSGGCCIVTSIAWDYAMIERGNVPVDLFLQAFRAVNKKWHAEDPDWYRDLESRYIG